MLSKHWIAGIALVSACTLTEDEFKDELIQTWCERGDECNLEEWEFEFDSREDCVEELEEDDWYEGCEYDEQKAEDCLDALDEASCGDLFRTIADDCSDAWDCDGYDTSD